MLNGLCEPFGPFKEDNKRNFKIKKAKLIYQPDNYDFVFVSFRENLFC